MPAPPAEFCRKIGRPSFQAHLLYHRGVASSSQVEEFFSSGPDGFHDPFLLPDMGKAVKRIQRALESQEVVGIFGDFDTDGVTATALLTLALKELGLKAVPYIPHRVAEGHGLNLQALKALREEDVTLLITVDCGTTSVKEVQYARSLGMDVIITDHHSLPPILPDACAIVNHNRPDSRYPFVGLAGVGLAFKLAQGIHKCLGKISPDDYLDLVTLGTVADLVPLKGENRSLVAQGLRVLNDGNRCGLRQIISSSGLSPGQIDTEAIAFGLAPRLNAAGRLNHAIVSLRLLTTSSQEEALCLSQELEQMNSQRRRLTEDALSTARAKAEAQLEDDYIIVVGEERQPPGISGLVAGKLVEEFYRPAVSYSIEDDIIRASARSVPEFDISSAFTQCSDLFVRFGGHPQAAGFVMDASNLDELGHRLRTNAREKLSGLDLRPTIYIDAEIAPSSLVGENFKFVESLAPFGQGNPAPTFLTRRVQVIDVAAMGNNSQHLRMKLKQGGALWEATAFWKGERLTEITDRIDIVFNMAVRYWLSQKTLRLNVLDFKASP